MPETRGGRRTGFPDISELGGETESPVRVGAVSEYDRKRIFTLALEAFDDPNLAELWFQTPNLQLGNRPPIESIGTPEGFNTVETVLRQIQYGVIG